MRVWVLLLIGLVAIPGNGRTQAHERWSWPEKAENLEVLPAGTGGHELGQVMRGFTRALGVRCAHCHVGEEDQPLSAFDFASDENPKKATAREMMRLLGDVNTHLEKIEPSGPKRVGMSCYTCHRGRPRPMTLAEELEEAYGSGGADAAIARYDELHERYFGHGAYDFDADALNATGYLALAAQDTAGAIVVLERNASLYPESWNVWDSLGEVYLASGARETAIEHYRHALALEPRDRNATEKLRELGALEDPAAETSDD